jgi:hypothetical protein
MLEYKTQSLVYQLESYKLHMLKVLVFVFKLLMYYIGRGDIPVVLLKLKNSLYKHNGLAIKGIFRHAGNEKTISEVKEQVISSQLVFTCLAESRHI